MKKFSFLRNSLLLSTVVCVVMISCQKDQSATTDQTTATEGSRISRVNGSGPFDGSIDAGYAASLAANYVKKYGDDDKKLPQGVEFNAKDLIDFLTGLQTKYKSNLIYVNFGVYGKGALPVNSKDYGKLTVFFSGNNITAPSSPRRTDGVASDDYLNHGQIYP